MNRQAKSISDSEKQLSKLETAYRELESRIGLEAANSPDIRGAFAEDAGALSKIKEKKDDYERTVNELREREARQKECAAQLTELARIRKSKTAHGVLLSEALGRALAEQYDDSFSPFFGDAYEEIRAAEAKIERTEEDLRKKNLPSGGIFASIKTTIDRSIKKTSLDFAKRRLDTMYADSGAAAFDSAELKTLSDSDALPAGVRSAYQKMLECEDERRALDERRDGLSAQIKEDGDAIDALGLSTGAGSARAKIRELEKEIGKTALAERIVLSRIGKRCIESAKQDGGRKKGGEEVSDAEGKTPDELGRLLEEAARLQSEIAARKTDIEEAAREIEAADTARKIASLKKRTEGIQKQIDRLSAEKADAENEIKLLCEKLKSMGREA